MRKSALRHGHVRIDAGRDCVTIKENMSAKGKWVAAGGLQHADKTAWSHNDNAGIIAVCVLYMVQSSVLHVLTLGVLTAYER